MVLLAVCGNAWAAETSQGSARIPLVSELEETFRPREFLNGEFKAKAGLESRYRFELRDDFNLNDAAYEDDAVNLFRNRLNLDLAYQPGKNGRTFRFFTEGQAAQSFAENGLNKSNLFVNQIDLRQLWAEMEKPVLEIPVSVKVGRQELAYGDERFVGPLNWTNTARVFDAVKVVYNPWQWFQLDVFFSKVVRVEPKRADKTVHSDHFYGIYGAYKKIKDHVIDTFLFIRNNRDESLAGERAGSRDPLKEYTAGNRFKGKKGPVDYGTEYAVQLGRRGHDEIEAWAFHQELGYTFSKQKGTPRIYTEYNHASGDRNPSDGVFSTFDNLFPTNHNKYGLIDFLPLKNMNDVMLGASVKPHTKVHLASEFHWFFLDAKESAWFNASGGTFRAANPAADTQLGEELDLYATYAVTKSLSALIGYSHFFAGPFAKDTGAHDDADFFYVQMLLKV